MLKWEREIELLKADHGMIVSVLRQIEGNPMAKMVITSQPNNAGVVVLERMRQMERNTDCLLAALERDQRAQTA